MTVPVQSLLFCRPEGGGGSRRLPRPAAPLRPGRRGPVAGRAAVTRWPCSAARPPSRSSPSAPPAWPAPRRSTSRCRPGNCWSPSTSPVRAPGSRAVPAVRCPRPSPGRPGPASCRPGGPGRSRPDCPAPTPCAPPSTRPSPNSVRETRRCPRSLRTRAERDRIGREIWSRPVGTTDLPLRAVHAAQSLGFLRPDPDFPVSLLSAGGWLRLRTPFGSIALRRDPAGGLGGPGGLSLSVGRG